jgi:DNA-binding transcriptional regulator YhcF (GntR family)
MGTDRDEERRKALAEAYDKLSPEEKQRRVVLEPAFRDAYNEVTQADRFSPVPWYFWAKWAPRLNPLLSMVYLKLRQFVFFNRQTGERREVVWPRQETLAAQIGSNRKSVLRALRELERLGFISSQKTRWNEPTTGYLVNGTKKYRVFFELPLVPEDAVELLLREMKSEGRREDHRESLLGTFGDEPVDNSHRESLLGTSLAVPKRDSRTITRTSTINVTNVGKSSYGKSSLRQRPEVQALNSEELASREGLAREIGESLKTWSGSWDGEAHQSEGFHRRVALLMPEHLVRQALAATQDAVARKRDGQGGCHHGPAAYFAGVVKKLAEEVGIDLGLKVGKAEGMPSPGPERATEARKGSAPPQDPGGPPLSMEEAKRGVRELLQRLAAEKK